MFDPQRRAFLVKEMFARHRLLLARKVIGKLAAVACTGMIESGVRRVDELSGGHQQIVQGKQEEFTNLDHHDFLNRGPCACP